jgi:hypothetical protein
MRLTAPLSATEAARQVPAPAKGAGGVAAVVRDRDPRAGNQLVTDRVRHVGEQFYAGHEALLPGSSRCAAALPLVS